MLTVFLFGCQPISFGRYLAQQYFFQFLGSTEAVLLATMAYDCYIAICNPMCYTLVISPRTCLLLAMASWSIGFALIKILKKRVLIFESDFSLLHIGE